MKKHLVCYVEMLVLSSFTLSFIFTEYLRWPKHLAKHKGLGCFERPLNYLYFPGRWVRRRLGVSRRMRSRDLELGSNRWDRLRDGPNPGKCYCQNQR